MNVSADNIPHPVIVDVNSNEYHVNWTAPKRPNGVVLFYDFRIRYLSFCSENAFTQFLHCLTLHLNYILDFTPKPGHYFLPHMIDNLIRETCINTF